MSRTATILGQRNTWWRDPNAKLPDVLPFKRQPAFDRVRARLFRGDRRRGVLLIGLRFVGKTELAKQVADAARQHDGLPGTQLAYVLLDEPKLRGSLTIDEILAAWDPFRNKDMPSLLVLDEAHRLSDPTPDASWGWARQLKGVIDDGRIDVLATGSDAGRLLEGAAEGAGRWDYVELEPLSFREFRQLRSPSGESPLEATRHQDLDSYLRMGGFPGFATERQPRQAMEGIQHYARAVLLDEMGGIRNIAKVERAFSILMDRSGSNLDTSSLSKSIGAKAETIERWLSDLESVRLIQRVPRTRAVDRSTLHLIRGQPKIHGTDPGLVAAFSRWADPMSDPHSRGSLYEAAVLRHLREVARESGPGSAIYCLQLPGSRGKKGEVDFVLLHGEEELFLVEVTSGQSEIEQKARFLREVGGDQAICGRRRVYATLVAPLDRSTRSDVPAVDAARFLESLLPLGDGDPLQPLRELSVLVGGQ